MKGKLIFEEEQSFVGTWMFYLVIGISVISIGGGMVMLLIHGKTEGIVGMVITALVLGGVVWLLAAARLHISIDEHNLYYRYPPFVSSEKTITKNDVNDIYVRKYRAIWEYGGWGYRFRFRSGRALTVAGEHGVQLETTNNKHILIGTQKPEEMERAIRRLKENWAQHG